MNLNFQDVSDEKLSNKISKTYFLVYHIFKNTFCEQPEYGRRNVNMVVLMNPFMRSTWDWYYSCIHVNLFGKNRLIEIELKLIACDVNFIQLFKKSHQFSIEFFMWKIVGQTPLEILNTFSITWAVFVR